eukprot:8633290-Heterocapsa_arctica.AAC.1
MRPSAALASMPTLTVALMPKSFIMLCMPNASAVPCAAAYNSASADDRDTACWVFAHTLSR